MIRGKRVFITGGSGFIGSMLIGRIVEENKVIVYDNFRRDSLSRRPWANHPNLTRIKGDVLDYPTMQKAMRGSRIVVHCAAVAGIDTVLEQPTETMRVNMVGTAKVLEAARTLSRLDRLVNFSTSEVFGQSAFRSEETDNTEIGVVGEARWTYAVGKLAGEHLTQAYYQEFGMPAVSVRPFNIYGPGQIGEGAMMVFIQRALCGDDLLIHGDGNQIRAWCYIDDFVDGLMMAIEHPDAVGESFNIGNARAVITIYGLAQTVVRVLGSSSKITFINRPGPDVELRVPSVEKAKRLVGFEAKIDLEAGIRRTAEHYRSLSQPILGNLGTHRWRRSLEPDKHQG